MKEILGLLFFVCIVVVTIFLAVTKQIDGKLTSIFLALALVGGFVIARYDLIQRFQHGDTKIELFAQQVSELKSKAIQDIQADIAAQKEALQLVIADANETRRKLEEQRKIAEKLVERMAEAEKILKQQQSKLEETAKRTEDADTRVAENESRVRSAEARVSSSETRLLELNKANKDLALLLTKMVWLQSVTKNEFGTPRATKALQEIEHELNRLVVVAIPNPVERDGWVRQLTTSLPAPN